MEELETTKAYLDGHVQSIFVLLDNLSEVIDESSYKEELEDLNEVVENTKKELEKAIKILAL